jgi:hypothetical protein
MHQPRFEPRVPQIQMLLLEKLTEYSAIILSDKYHLSLTAEHVGGSLSGLTSESM